MKKTLTKAEEQVMHAIWKVEKGFLKDILDALPEPKPHPNTVATVLKILVEKKFVGIETFGRINQYYSIVDRNDYSNSSIKNIVDSYFNGSFQNVVSFMVEKNDLSVQDLELLLKQIKKQKK